MRIFAAAILTALIAAAAPAQVIEFESNGLRYLTLTRNGMTIMFAHLPVQVRGYSVLQVAIANGSSSTWVVRPEDFVFRRSDETEIRATSAHRVVGEFLDHGGRADVVKLVTAYEAGLYGVQKIKATNGYEQRRQSAMAELTSTRLKAAAAASAIVMIPVRMRPGESTDGAIFYPTSGKPLGAGQLLVSAAGTVFEFDTESPQPQDSR